jgi:hypothetical protein
MVIPFSNTPDYIGAPIFDLNQIQHRRAAFIVHKIHGHCPAFHGNDVTCRGVAKRKARTSMPHKRRAQTTRTDDAHMEAAYATR